MAYTAQQAADRAEISDLTSRYAMAVDSKDWDAYRTLFSDDAAIDYTDAGGVAGSLDEVVPWLAEALGFCCATQHNMTSQVVEFDGDDDARACTYYIAQHVMLDGSGGEALLLFAGFYRDVLRRVDGTWRIARRVEKGTWLQGPYPPDVPKPAWYGTADHPTPAV
jgi:hypothetical protein